MEFIDLIEDLPSDTKQKVEDARNKYNTCLRDAIRFETRFTLASGMETSQPSERQEQSATVTVPIKVDVSYPAHLQKFEIPDKFALAVFLSRIRPALQRLMKSAEDVSGFIDAFQEYPNIFHYRGGAICYASGEARELLAMADGYDLAKELLKSDSNILGCYTCTPKHGSSRFADNEPHENGSISLFWGCIGLVARILDVAIHELTAVVLAHELSHAYIHLGCDIAGSRWRDESLQHAHPSVIEGLAQYYTERCLLRLINEVPGAWRAYEKLLEKQPEAYTAHQAWLNEIRVDPEAARLAVISLRKGAPIDPGRF